MTALDFLYLTIGIGIVAIAAAVVFIAYEVIKTLVLLRRLLSKADNILLDVKAVKDTVKGGVVEKISDIINFFRGEEKRQKKVAYR